MSVHGQPRNICPYCQKRFDTREGLEAHQSRKKHRVSDRHEGAPMEKEMRRYDADRRRQIKRGGT